MIDQRLTEFYHDGFVFDVIDAGPMDAIPVVLLHGFPQRASSWRQVAERLHQRGYRTFSPDQRGYSPRARPKSRFAYGAGKLVGDISALIDAIGEPVHLAGHDWGAMVAWGVAAEHPRKIRSLTTVSVAHPAAFMSSMVRSNQLLKSYYMLLFQFPFLPELLLGKRGGYGDRLLRGAGMTRAMVQDFHDDIVDYGALPGGLGYYRSLIATSPASIRRKVSAPTTHVWSDGDIALGRKSSELCERWVTGPYQLEIINGASHWLPDERPDELAAHIAARAESTLP